MKKCPACEKWTLEFDDYFGRFRCFHPDCGWMAISSTDREIRRLREHQQLIRVEQIHIEEMNLDLTLDYDVLNDALVFNFGLNEPAFDLPDGDGRMIWQISHTTGSVAGFVILDAKKSDVSQINVYFDIASKKNDVEDRLKRFPDAIATGRASRVLIEKVAVMAHIKEPSYQSSHSAYIEAFKEVYSKFKETFLVEGMTEGQPLTT